MKQRILSLVPGATEIIAALGASGELVGISHECDYPAEVTGLPRVTSSAVSSAQSSLAIDASVRAIAIEGQPLFMIDAGLLAALAPTLIVTQALCDVCAVSDGEAMRLAAVMDPAPRVVSLVGSTLTGVWDDIRLLGAALGRDAHGHALVASLEARLRSVHETLRHARAPRPRVAVIEWLDPVYAAGHWTPDVVRCAGGIDVLAQPGSHSVRIDASRIRDASPDLLLFAPCGFDVHRARAEAESLLASPGWAWARGREAWALDGNALTSRPGPRLADAVEAMAAIVAPALFPAPPARYAVNLTR